MADNKRDFDEQSRRRNSNNEDIGSNTTGSMGSSRSQSGRDNIGVLFRISSGQLRSQLGP